MSLRVAHKLRLRRNFGKISKIVDIPNLIEIQRRSYDEFLQLSLQAAERRDVGLQGVFRSVFPIKDFNETASLEFVSYALGEPKYSVKECHERGMTFAAPLKVTIQLVIWDVDAETGSRSIKNVKEQEVYFGEIPLMTEHGTFMINGTERVIVSQLHRSPGVFFSQPEKGMFAAQIIPYRGSWVEFEFDAKNLLHVRIDRKRKFLASVFLRALGMKADAEILKRFFKADRILVREGRLSWKVSPNLVGMKLSKGIFGPKDASGHKPEIVHSGKKITAAQLA
jgi:DNA-directed RNA polymerase subunit beta